ncbi:MAG: hypothetical protein K6U74_13690 [Firmicutes bacterium]|nr:hypothetical protein [Bacillota bacterium]
MEKVLQQILEKLTELSQGQEALQKGQEALRSDVTELRQGQESLQNRVSALQQGQASLQDQIAKLEIRLETEAFEKIGALFDGFQLHREILERIEKKLEAHDERLDSHGDEIILLRSKKKK